MSFVHKFSTRRGLHFRLHRATTNHVPKNILNMLPLGRVKRGYYDHIRSTQISGPLSRPAIAVQTRSPPMSNVLKQKNMIPFQNVRAKICYFEAYRHYTATGYCTTRFFSAFTTVCDSRVTSPRGILLGTLYVRCALFNKSYKTERATAIAQRYNSFYGTLQSTDVCV